MPYEASPEEQAVASAASGADDVPPLLAWLGSASRHASGIGGQREDRVQALVLAASSSIRRAPLQAVALAAAAGFIAGAIWSRR